MTHGPNKNTLADPSKQLTEAEPLERTPSLLYVEDDSVQAMIITKLLKNEGFNVIHSKNGFEALDRLQEHTIDIVLTDHYMPQMNGVELVQATKDQAFDVPVVLMTATNDLGIAFQALSAGAADFLQKDTDSEYLSLISTVLHRTLEKHRLQLRSKRLEAELAREKELSYLALDAVSQAVITLDGDLNVRYWNSFFSSLLGLDDTKAAVGFSIDQLSEMLVGNKGEINGSASAEIVKSHLICLVNKECNYLELRISELILELRANELSDLGFVIAFNDVTMLRANQEVLDSVINRAPVPIIAVNESGDLFLANDKACSLMCEDRSRLLAMNINEFVPEESRAHHHIYLKKYFEEADSRPMRGGIDTELIDVNGKVVHVEIALSGVNWFGEKRVLATIVDIGHRKKAEELLHRANQLTQSIIDHSPFSIVATDLAGTIIAVSPALENMLLYRREDLIGNKNVTLFHRVEELNLLVAETCEEFNLEINEPFQALTERARRGQEDSKEYSYLKQDGTTVPVNLTVTSMLSEENVVTGYLFVSYDITEQKRASEYVAHIAHHDALTGLPNRMLMHDRLNQALLLAKRNGTKVGILAIDLDHFKRVNDSLGHLAGDELLTVVAERLCKSVRASDTVCRMGGDEFVIIVPDVTEVEDVRAIANKILHKLAKPIKLGGNSIIITPSLGLSLAPDDGTSTEELLKHADIAMYEVKNSGRNGFQIFTQELAEVKRDNIALEQDLHQAYKAGDLTLFYQPQVDTSSGQVIGMEALIRWPHQEKGMIPPVVFIPLAENTALIIKIGEWILSKACKEIQALRKAHNADYRLAVNVSPRQFDDPNFVRATDYALRRSGLPANRLEMEITEGLLVTESSSVRGKLNALHEMGISLAIDDFGTGYSGLSYVASYPISVIKIDRAFMAVEKKENSAIVGAITAIADGLELEVLAEGVETDEQLEFIQNKGCFLVQGYYFSRPVPYAELPKAIRSIEATLDETRLSNKS